MRTKSPGIETHPRMVKSETVQVIGLRPHYHRGSKSNKSLRKFELDLGNV
jgi:hypothetical protein